MDHQPTTPPPPHRFRNEGNTCYINSVIQALFASKHFRNHVVTSDITTTNDMGIAPLFKVLFEEMQNNSTSQVVRLRPLFNVLEERIGGILELFQENDAMEFMTILLDELAKDYKFADTSTTSTSAYPQRCLEPVFAKLDTLLKKQWFESHNDALSGFVDVIYGQYVIQVRCTNCRFSSHRGEPFVSLDLSLGGDATLDMTDLVSTAFNCEHIHERECDKNCGKAPGVRSSRIWKTPKMLLIHFKRFHGFQKITTPVAVPDTLHLKPYSLFCENPNYNLVAIICHVGQLQSGHYFALVKRQDTWYLVDDDMAPRKITDIQQYSRTFYIVVYDQHE